jgi:hypothetical protein
MKTMFKVMMVVTIAFMVACTPKTDEKANIIAKIDAYKASIEAMKADTSACCTADTMKKEECCTTNFPLVDTMTAYETDIQGLIDGSKMDEAAKTEVVAKFNEIKLAANTQLIDAYTKCNEGCMTKMNADKVALEAQIAAFNKKTPANVKDSITLAKTNLDSMITEMTTKNAEKIESLKKIAESLAAPAAEAPAAETK